MRQLSTKEFSWNKETRVLYQEASTLKLKTPSGSFKLKSHHTNRVMTMMIKEVDEDEEGDVRAWTYIPYEHREGDKPFTLVILND